jgi:hypothetical protein
MQQSSSWCIGPSFGQLLDENDGIGPGFGALRLMAALAVLAAHAPGLTTGHYDVLDFEAADLSRVNCRGRIFRHERLPGNPKLPE